MGVFGLNFRVLFTFSVDNLPFIVDKDPLLGITLLKIRLFLWKISPLYQLFPHFYGQKESFFLIY